MATKLPYMNAYGKIASIMDKISSAQRPPKFTLDFMETKLGFKSTSDRAIIPLLIKMGFLSSDRSPTDLYSKYKNPNLKGAAVAQGIRNAYPEIFEINEYAQDAEKKDIEGIVAQVTGMGSVEPTLKAIVNTFLKLRDLADFEDHSDDDEEEQEYEQERSDVFPQTHRSSSNERTLGIGLSYTIYLKLPETTDVEVYNAIFRSLRENLLDSE